MPLTWKGSQLEPISFLFDEFESFVTISLIRRNLLHFFTLDSKIILIFVKKFCSIGMTSIYLPITQEIIDFMMEAYIRKFIGFHGRL